jgi:hypothetical protein
MGHELSWLMAMAGGIVWALAIARLIVTLVLFVSIGGATWVAFSHFEFGLQDLGFPPANGDPVFVSTILALPAIALIAVRYRRLGGWRPALMAVLFFALLVLLALSYRFPALLATVGLAWSLRVSPRLTRPRRVSWVLLAVAAALCLLPVDVSLRVRPRGPHCSPAVTGCPGRGAQEADDRGDIVFLSYILYNEPKCIWVW